MKTGIDRVVGPGRHARRAVFGAALIVMIGTTLPDSAAGQARPFSPSEVAQLLGYSNADIQRLEAGAIVTRDLQRVRENQLRASVAVKVESPLNSIADALEEGRYLRLGDDVLGLTELSVPVDETEWQAVAFSADEIDEVAELLDAGPGDDLNLSTDEIDLLKERLGGYRARQPEALEAASAAYREILSGRFTAYLANGLDGVAPYDRGRGNTSSAADEIREQEAEAATRIADRFPAFMAAVTNFPNSQSPGIVNRFFWKKVMVERRPAFILIHQTIESNPEYLIVSVRQYFVGHTYNSLQAITLALPDGDDTYVFQANTTATDQITGFFSGIAQSIGQPMLRESLVEFFDQARAATP